MAFDSKLNENSHYLVGAELRRVKIRSHFDICN